MRTTMAFLAGLLGSLTPTHCVEAVVYHFIPFIVSVLALAHVSLALDAPLVCITATCDGDTTRVQLEWEPIAGASSYQVLGRMDWNDEDSLLAVTTSTTHELAQPTDWDWISQLEKYGYYTVRAASFPTNGLVAYYPLNGNADDVSGNELHGTLTGATTISEGVVGECLLFDNNNERVMTGVALSSDIFTINIWAKQYNSAKISLCGTLTNPYGGKSGFMFHTGGYGGSVPGAASMLSWQSNQVWLNLFGTDIVTPSNWNMYTFVFVGGGTSKIYSNGVLTAALENSPSGPIHSSLLQIGRSFTTISSSNQVWGGLIDEVGVWSLELTQSEVELLFNSGVGVTFP